MATLAFSGIGVMDAPMARHPAADRFDFGFAVDRMRKDLALAEVRGTGAVPAMGGRRQDTGAPARRLPK